MENNFDFEAMIERIKARKKELGLTNKQLSDMSDVSFGTLNKILGSETKEPSINNIIKISVALGLSTDYVINGTEQKENPSPVEDEREAYRNMLSELTEDELKEMKNFTSYLRWKRDHPQDASDK